MLPATPATTPEHQETVLRWEQFQEVFAQGHRQGEHCSLVGPTGSGKTLLELELLEIIGSRKGKDGRPSRVVILLYKPRDDTLKRLDPEEWKRIKKWPPGYGEEHCVVWPKTGKASEAARQHRAVFLPLLDQVYAEGGQTVCIGEAAYFERPLPSGLGMTGTLEQFWSTARSLKLTVVSDTQRPRHVSRLMWSEPAWLFIFPLDDQDDLKRVAELSGRKMDVYRIASQLGGHEFLCVRRQRDGRRALYVSKVEANAGPTHRRSSLPRRRGDSIPEDKE